MCGIAGIVTLRPVLRGDWIYRMTTALRHRGPDDEGYLASEISSTHLKLAELGGDDCRIEKLQPVGDYKEPANLYLGHRRLSILDLSASGHQPMCFGGNLWIVFNGEIYNYVELRNELKADGYRFTTATDTEVVLAAYSRWREDCVRRFNGDWAFCIFDAKRRSLFLSRDRYGIKPLYYFEDQEFFSFASEVKALLTIPSVPRRMNKVKAFEYCVLFCRDHTEETFFEGIRQLSPGENMVVDLHNVSHRKSRYYCLTANLESEPYDHRKASSFASDIRELLTDSIRLRLRADVPVGTCLSGGLDSSAVVTIMARLMGAEGKRLKTFTASFPGEPFDESYFAGLVADRVGVQNHMLYPTVEGYWRDIARVLYHQDEPFGGASIYSEWSVMQEASKHVKVILDGHGGDEVFAGYKDYRIAFLANLLLTGKGLTFLSELFHMAGMHKDMRKFFKEVKSLPIYALGPMGKQTVYRLYYRRQLSASLKGLGFKSAPNLDPIKEKFAGNLNELLLHYMRAYTLPYLLRGEDRSCMAHSIEARIPYTDYRLVDYVFSIPALYKVRNGWTKWLLRLAVNDLMPAEIVWRKEKLGFATPRWATKDDEWNLWLAQYFSADGLGIGGDSPAVGKKEAHLSIRVPSQVQ